MAFATELLEKNLIYQSTNILSNYSLSKTGNTLAMTNELELYTATKWTFKLAQTTTKCRHEE